MQPKIYIVYIFTVLLVTCGGPVNLSHEVYQAPERPVFHAEKVGKFRLGNIPVSGPVFLDARHTAWVSAQGKILIFDHVENEEVKNIDSKDDITYMSLGQHSMYWIEEEQDQHHITRYDIAEDDDIWRKSCFPTTVAPTLWDSLVIVSGVNGQIVARDTASGRQRWSSDVREGVYVSPVIYHQDLLIITDKGNLYSLDASSGKISWKENLRRTFLTRTIDNDALYLGGFDGTMLRYDLSKRTIQWADKTPHPVRSEPLLDGEKVIWVNGGGEVYRIDKETGANSQMVDLGTPVSNTPALTEQGYLITGGDRILYHVDFSDGGFLNLLEFAGRLRSKPFYFREHWYVTMEDRWMYAIQ